MSSINLVLASPHRAYHPPPDLSRPELRAAYELGRRNRVGGGQSHNAALTELLAAGGLEVLRAYSAGRQSDARAPAPLAFELVFAAATGLFGITFDVRTDVRRQLPWLVGTMLGMWSLQAARSRLEVRRARALDLTPETAPLQGFAPSEAMQIAIAVGDQLWTRIRRGSWTRQAPSTVTAAQVTRELMRRWSWRAAVKAAAGPAA